MLIITDNYFPKPLPRVARLLAEKGSIPPFWIFCHRLALRCGLSPAEGCGTFLQFANPHKKCPLAAELSSANHSNVRSARARYECESGLFRTFCPRITGFLPVSTEWQLSLGMRGCRFSRYGWVFGSTEADSWPLYNYQATFG